ncbi:MAG: PAS domain-containing sensor histidine kinase [Deltaproteobacteria bacterium]|nr:PAS domain-containing sensor histidine kinase [Deltaproteobacteria bacterium]
MESIDPKGYAGEKRASEFPAILMSILEHSGEIIFTMNDKGVILSFSRGGEKHLGFASHDVIGRMAQDLTRDAGALEKGLELCRKEGRVAIPGFEFRTRGGGYAPFDLSLVRISDGVQQRDIVLGIGKEMCAEESLQEDLVRVDRLAELGRATSGIAHDINNPVAVIGEISGWMEALISDAGGLSPEERAELVKAVQDIKKQTRRCKAITHQVLNFAGDSRSEKRTFDLYEVLKNTVQFMRSETIFRNIEIVLDLMEAPPTLQSDPERLEQVFINLLSNAVYAIKEKGEPGGQIRIQTSIEGDTVEVTVSDNGIGISEAMREKIFDLFYTTKPSGKGTGLGLPICRNIIKKLGGEITFHSELGAGTSFRVQIPVS